MKEAKFTKGPWVVIHNNTVTDLEKKTVIARSRRTKDCRSIPNAHLIAAAPELYDSGTPLAQILERAVEEGASNLTLIITREIAEEILLARSKARGEL